MKRGKGKDFLLLKKKKTFEQAMAYLIPPLKDKSILEAEKLQVWYVFGLSSKLADYDNFIKIFQDCLAKKRIQ